MSSGASERIFGFAADIFAMLRTLSEQHPETPAEMRSALGLVMVLLLEQGFPDLEERVAVFDAWVPATRDYLLSRGKRNMSETVHTTEPVEQAPATGPEHTLASTFSKPQHMALLAHLADMEHRLMQHFTGHKAAPAADVHTPEEQKAEAEAHAAGVAPVPPAADPPAA